MKQDGFWMPYKDRIISFKILSPFKRKTPPMRANTKFGDDSHL